MAFTIGMRPYFGVNSGLGARTTALLIGLVACSTKPTDTLGDAAPGVRNDAALGALPDGPAAACILEGTAGYHEESCDGMVYDVAIPPQCVTDRACGLIVDVHGLTMSGNMEDANTNMRALGAQYGYVVIQPNANPAPPSSMFVTPGDDDRIYAFLQSAIVTLGIDPRRVHFTGFSDGGEMTFRFTCAHADLFASVAPATGGGCFKPDQMPSREIPVLFMNGTKDQLNDYQSDALPQRDAIISTWNMGAGTVVAQGTAYVRTRYTSPAGNVFEFLQHDYQSDDPILGGHCYPGSTDPGTQPGQLFPFGCVPPNEFAWGVEVVKFFMAHE
jgi:pimeloyl-ACP methyl ester carboxylesterase